MDRIVIEGIRCRTRIGFREHEKHADQDLLVTVELRTDLAPPAGADDVEQGVDYRSVTKAVKDAVEDGPRKLIERVADDVARVCLAFPRVAAVRVKVQKPGALSDAADVWVELERSR